MKKTQALLSLLLAILLCGSLFSCTDAPDSPPTMSSSSLPDEPQTDDWTTSPSGVSAIRTALSDAFSRIGTDILFSEEYDTTADYALTYDEIRTLLSACEYNVYKLSSVEVTYKQHYVGSFKNIVSLADAIVTRMINNYKMAAVTADEEILTTTLVNCYLNAIGDKYGAYYSEADQPSYEENITGTYSGIGVSVTLTASGYIEVLNVFPDTPAIEAGLMPGDLFVAVGGEDIAELGYYPAIEKMRGEVGTAVSFTVERDGKRIDMTVTRAIVTEKVVYHSVLDGDVGYIRITSFDKNTYAQFVSAYTALCAQGIDSIVFDLRANPGGLLDSVVAVLEYILPAGEIVHLNYKTKSYTVSTVLNLVGKSDPNYVAYLDGYLNDHKIDLPMVVLTNEYTASAGELFTGALRDYDAKGKIDATVMGTTTYGKGVGQSGMQNILKVDQEGNTDGSLLSLTTFYYTPPYSGNYDGVGITPDVTVELSETAKSINIYKLTYADDAQLQAAHNALKDR